MLLLPLLFLLIRDGVSESEDNGKIKVNMCGETWSSMKCLVPDVCNRPGPTRNALEEMETEIDKNCAAVVKLRVISKQRWVISFESFKPTVNSIKLEQGTTKFECLIVDGKVVATYKGKKVGGNKLNAGSPLKCSFGVTTEEPDEVLPTQQDLVLTAEGEQPSRIILPIFYSIMRSCNPENALVKEGPVGTKMLVKVGEASYSTDLACGSKFTLMFRDKNTGQFEEATRINCILKDGNYGYLVTKQDQSSAFFDSTFDAHCEIPNCEMCPDYPPKPGGASSAAISPFKVIVKENGCKKLTCISGRIKLDSSRKLYDEAECAYKKGSHFYSIGEEIVVNSARCAEKAVCSETEAAQLCSNCIIDQRNQPRCSEGTNLTLIEKGEEIFIHAVHCNEKSGELEVMKTRDSSRPLAIADRFKCTIAPPVKDDSKSFSEAQLDELSEGRAYPWKITAAVLIVVVVFLIAVLVHCTIKDTKQKKRAKTQAEALSAVKVQKESSKLTTSESKVSKKEETSIPIEGIKPMSSPVGTPEPAGTKSGSLPGSEMKPVKRD